MARTIGVGLVSVGWMGRLHSRSYRNVHEYYPELDITPELVIAADPNPAAAADAVNRLGYRESTADIADVLAHPDVDVVSICAPNFLHHTFALQAAAAGKPFWIEKPMGRGIQESAEIAQAAHSAGLVTSVGFNYRHAPAVEYAKELIADGTLGRITNLHVRLNADYSSDPRAALTWRFERGRAGSGVLGDLLAHGVDLAHYLVGRITQVTAMTETFITERPIPASATARRGDEVSANQPLGAVENEDYAAILARLDGGAVATLESTRVAVGPHAEYVIEVFGTEGSLRWDFQRLNELQLATDGTGYRTVFARPGVGEFGRFQPGAGTSMGFDDLKTIEAAQFLRSVADGVQLAPSVSDGWQATAVLQAAEDSVRSGRWESVAEVSGPTTYGAPRP
ncbi:MAG: Gfo/Idh/MocA family protein [Mycetocola sp.]